MLMQQQLSQNVRSYLQKLILTHVNSVSKVKPMMIEMNALYQNKICKGQYDIKNNRYSFHSNSLKGIAHKQLYVLQVENDNQFVDKNSKKVINDDQRIKFVSQMKMKHTMLNKKKDQHMRQLSLKRKEKQQEYKNKRSVQAHEIKQQKRKSIEKRLEQLSQQAFKRSVYIRTRNKQYTTISKEITLLQKMQQNFKQIQISTLQEKKMKLAQIRQIHKPISKFQFQQHIQKIKQYKSMKQLQKIQKPVKDMQFPNVGNFYKSRWYKEAQKQQKFDDKQIQIIYKKEALKLLKDKQINFTKYIKNNFAPEQDQKKVQQLLKRQKMPILRKQPQQIRQMGLNNLNFSKKQARSKQDLAYKKQLVKKTQNIGIQKAKDYLSQMTEHRKTTSFRYNSIQSKQKKPISSQEKLKIIKQYVSKLEKKATAKYQLQKGKNNMIDEEIDQLYMKAINAKQNQWSIK